MKIYQILLAFLLIGTSSYSQTIDQTWFYVPGYETYFVSAQNAADYQLPESGLNQTWDFSDAIEDRRDTLSFLEPQGLPDFEQFPSSTVAELNSFLGQISFYEHNNDSLNLIGIKVNEFFSLQYLKPYLITTAPLSYGDTIFHTIISRATLNGVEQAIDTANMEIIFAGIGTVMTPLEQVDDCIMLERIVRDKSGLLESHSASFFKDNLTNRIATYTDAYPPGGLVKIFEWNEGFILSDTEDSMVSQLDLTISNDLSGNLTLHTNNGFDAAIILYNANGLLISKSNEYLVAGANVLEHSGDNGQFFMLVVDKSTNNFKTFSLGRFK